jgi:hypothetical protein
MPGGNDSYGATIIADGPIGWFRFSELLAGSAITAGSQDPQALCLDSSASGNLNPGVIPYPNASYLQYGSAVVANSPSLLTTRGPNNDGGSALFPSTATQALINMVSSPDGGDLILQPTAAVTVEAWHTPNVIGANAKQVLVCYGTDASSLASYCLFHSGTTAINHVFAFAVNIAGTLRTATAALPALVVGTTYHAVGVYTGTAVQIFVNGVLQGTTAITGAIQYAAFPGLGLAFGNDPSNTDANLQGSLDEAAIYSQPLTLSRIAYHYRQGSTLLPFVWRH